MTKLLTCLADQVAVGTTKCQKMPQLIKGFILAPNDFSATDVQLADATFWQDKVKAPKKDRIYIFPTADEFEVASEDAVYQDTPLGISSVRDGQYRFRLMMRLNLYQHKNLYSFKGYDGRIILIDNENKLIGTDLSDGNFTGYALGMFNPEKVRFNDGSVPTKSPVYFSLEDNTELDSQGAMADGVIIKSITPLTPVSVEVNSAAADNINVTVKSAIYDEAITGLVQADFVLLDGAGAAQTISGLTDNGDGTYDLAGAGLVSGTVNLVAPASLSLDAYESIGAATVTI